MAAINLTPGHKYMLCTENTLYAAPKHLGWEQLGLRQPLRVKRHWGDHEDQCALETQARLPLPPHMLL